MKVGLYSKVKKEFPIANFQLSMTFDIGHPGSMRIVCIPVFFLSLYICFGNLMEFMVTIHPWIVGKTLEMDTSHLCNAEVSGTARI